MKYLAAEYLSEEGIKCPQKTALKRTYTSVTDNGTSGDSEGIANALDGKHNGTAWYPSELSQQSLKLSLQKPVEVNAAEVALD
ncbi:MAG: hypothetical protein V8S55_04400 [Mediterraneibacter faecis]